MKRTSELRNLKRALDESWFAALFPPDLQQELRHFVNCHSGGRPRRKARKRLAKVLRFQRAEKV